MLRDQLGHLAAPKTAGLLQTLMVLFVRLPADNPQKTVALDCLRYAVEWASLILKRHHPSIFFSSRLLAQALNRLALRMNQTTATTMTMLNKAKKSSLDSCMLCPPFNRQHLSTL